MYGEGVAIGDLLPAELREGYFETWRPKSPAWFASERDLWFYYREVSDSALWAEFVARWWVVIRSEYWAQASRYQD
jgi:hypothetical protein